MRVVLLTGGELRHTFVRKVIALAPRLEVVASFCEGTEKSLERIVASKDEVNSRRLWHLKGREQAEQDYFAPLVRVAEDRSQPRFIPKGAINDQVAAIHELQPDVLACYGSSIIREPLLSDFEGRFVNIHLGLSPYYRGSGTNFWPLANNEPQFVGATFMHIDAGIDTGAIIHQMHARYYPGDTPHTVGNRLIADMAFVYAELLAKFDQLPRMPQPPKPAVERYYRKQDFTEESVDLVYRNFAAGLVEQRLASDELPEIVTNPAITERGVV